MENEFHDSQKVVSDLPALVKMKIKLSSVFRNFHQEINQGRPYDEILSSIFDELNPVIPFDRIGIALIDDDTDIIKFHWVKSTMPVKWLKEDYSANYKTSSLRKIIENKEPRIINNLEEYYIANPGSLSTDLALRDGIKSSLTCPLINDDKPVGVVFFSSSRPYTYGKSHIEIFNEVAEELSLLVDKKSFRNIKSGEQTFRTFIKDLKPICHYFQKSLQNLKVLPEENESYDHLRNILRELESLIKGIESSSLESQNADLVTMLHETLNNYKNNDKRINLSLEFDNISDKTSLNTEGIRLALKSFLDSAIKHSFPFSGINVSVNQKENEHKIIFQISLSSKTDIQVDDILMPDNFDAHKFTEQHDNETVIGFWVSYQAEPDQVKLS